MVLSYSVEGVSLAKKNTVILYIYTCGDSTVLNVYMHAAKFNKGEHTSFNSFVPGACLVYNITCIITHVTGSNFESSYGKWGSQ